MRKSVKDVQPGYFYAPGGLGGFYGPMAMPPGGAVRASGDADSTPGWRIKVGYIGTGIAIGLVVYPFVGKALKHLQPGLDKLFDGMTGKVEGLAETASDLLAKAKQSLHDDEAKEQAKNEARANGKDRAHFDHGHDHDHSKRDR